VIEGRVDVNGQSLEPGDGAGITDETALTVAAPGGAAHFLLFDLN
jgi:redox-sensitive bicupin YhaK (pirin superfamily)